jgi:drug/metabolite transporter (DMT)-like permease
MSGAREGEHSWALSRADGFLLLTMMLWGVNFSVVKFALAELPPLAFNGIRFLIAAGTMLVLALLTGRRLTFESRHLVHLVGLGLVGNTAYQLFFVFGIASTTADNTSLIYATLPAWVALIGTIFGLERVAAWGWLGIGLSLLGIALIVFGSDHSAHFRLGGPSLKGDLLILIGTICWATYTLLMRPMTIHYSAVSVTSFSTAIGTIPLALLAVPSWRELEWTGVSFSAWAAVAASGIFAIGIAYFLWNYGVSRLGSARTSLHSNLAPPIALLTAWVWLGETFRPLQWLGTFLVLTGVVLARRFTRFVG